MVELQHILIWLHELKNVYEENKSYLTELDSAIGDADHGINMNRGFNAVQEALEKDTPADISAALKTTAMALIKTVGGAAGPLYGTFFLKAGAQTAGKQKLDAQDICGMMEAGVQGIIQRGKARVKDKTMLDCWLPALNALKEAESRGLGMAEILTQCVKAAEAGMKATIPLMARKGRASYLGERSQGHQDPGATSSYLMLKTAGEIWMTAVPG